MVMKPSERSVSGKQFSLETEKRVTSTAQGSGGTSSRAQSPSMLRCMDSQGAVGAQENYEHHNKSLELIFIG